MKQYNISFRCFYADGSYTTHRQDMSLKEIGKWIEAYTFTHPECKRISVSVWPGDSSI